MPSTGCDQASVIIQNPYQSGSAQLKRTGVAWPSRVLIQLRRRSPAQPGPTHFRIANGKIGASVTQVDGTTVVAGPMEGGLDLDKFWQAQGFLNGGKPEKPVPLEGVEARTTDEMVEVVVPTLLLEGNPDVLCIEWCNGQTVR